MATAKQLAARKRFAALAKSGALAKMRKKAKRAPAAAKSAPKKRAANPAPKKRKQTQRGGCNPLYKIQVQTSKGWNTIATATNFEKAEESARAIHKLAPTKRLRVDG